MGVYISDKDGKLKKVAGNFIPKENPNLGCLRTKVLWENPNPNQAFTPQRVALLDGNYDYLLFIYSIRVMSASSPNQQSVFIDRGAKTTSLDYVAPNTATSGSFTGGIKRGVIINSSMTQVTFGDAEYAETTNLSINNNFNIPIKILGLYKQPAMIYTGSELHEGNGIRIENGVISTAFKNLEFVGNYSATTAMLSVEIDLSNYNYLAFVSHGRGGQGDLGVFFGQGLTWTTKLGDSSMSKAFAYCYWGYSFSSALLISYNGSKTYVQKGDSAGSAFSYATGKPSYLTVSGSSGSAEQSYITLYRSKK